jgi:hypothetical protein
MNPPGLRCLRAVVVSAAWLCVVPLVSAQQLAPIRYTLSFPAAHTHYVDV